MNKELLNRVAGLGIFFWIIKILSTTVGETGADYVIDSVGIGLLNTTLLMGVVTMGSILWQFRMKRYFAPAYWFLIIMMSVEGTLITDLLVDDFGVSLIILDVVFTLIMIGIFYLWYKEESTLSIHTINTKRREIFYWLIVLITFALGTGIGDTLSEYLDAGYLYSLLLFSMIFAFAGGLFYLKFIDGVLAFWIAFIVTRPIGASLGDLMIQKPVDGGYGLGLMNVNVLFFMIILALITYLTTTKMDVDTVEVKNDAD